MRYIGPKEAMTKLVDFVMPHNCRKELRLAAARHRAAVLDALDLIQSHPDKITRAIKEDRRAKPR